MPATHDATLHGVVFDILVRSESRVGFAVGKRGESNIRCELTRTVPRAGHFPWLVQHDG